MIVVTLRMASTNHLGATLVRPHSLRDPIKEAFHLSTVLETYFTDSLFTNSLLLRVRIRHDVVGEEKNRTVT